MKQLLLFVLALLPMMVCAYDLSDNGIYYKIKSDGSLEVTGLASWTTVADIPSSIIVNGMKYRVTSIGAYAFNGRSDITYLSIPYSVKSIGEYAFMDCGSSMMVNIADPESWCQMQLANEHASPLSSAGKMLVHDIETTSFEVPSTVTSIGAFTFYQCSCLKSLSIPGTVTSIGNSAFESCDYLTSLTLNEGLQSIGGSAFEGCKRLSSVTIPNSVTFISICAFRGCSSLTSINIPNSVTSIEWSAFRDCSNLASITILQSMGYIGENVFWGCNNLTAVNISDLEAFLNIWFMMGDYPSNPLYYAHHLFLNGEEIVDLIVPNGVTSIREYALINCSNIKSVYIPNSVTSIGISAFTGCSRLATIYCNNSIPPSCSYSFSIDKEKCVVWVPKGSINAYKEANEWKDFKSIREITDGDVNLDGKVNKDDVDALVAYIMGENPEMVKEYMIDVNRDGKVNVADLTQVISFTQAEAKL